MNNPAKLMQAADDFHQAAASLIDELRAAIEGAPVSLRADTDAQINDLRATVRAITAETRRVVRRRALENTR